MSAVSVSMADLEASHLIDVANRLGLAQQYGNDRIFLQAVGELNDYWQDVSLSQFLLKLGESLERWGRDELFFPLRCRFEGRNVEVWQWSGADWTAIAEDGLESYFVDSENQDLWLIEPDGQLIKGWVFTDNSAQPAALNWLKEGF